MQSSQKEVRALCEQVLAADQAKNEEAVFGLLTELKQAIRLHIVDKLDGWRH